MYCNKSFNGSGRSSQSLFGQRPPQRKERCRLPVRLGLPQVLLREYVRDFWQYDEPALR